MEEQIRSNRRKIFWGITAYIALVVCTATLFCVMMLQRYGADIAWIFMVVFIILDVCAVWFATRSGMRLMLRLVNATPVYRGGFQKVQDAVDNIAIASGLPVPELMFIDDSSCNAFSLKQGGRRMIFFTRGLIRDLDDDELTAVMGHEMGHLYNEDAALNALILSLGGFSMLMGYMLRELMTSKKSGVVEGGISDTFKGLALYVWFALLLALMLTPLFFLGFPVGASPLPERVVAFWVALPLALTSLLLAVLLGSAMRKLINPSREMLADELCVKWTMYPEGLARALTDASSHATRYRFKALRSTWFVPCHFADPQPSPRERIAYLEDTLHFRFVE